MRNRKDHTSLTCLAIVSLAAMLHLTPLRSTALDWWDVSCWLVPWASWCPGATVDPPGIGGPDVPECGTFVGPCQL